MNEKEKTNNKFRWYVVHTYSGHENKVKTALKQRVESLGIKDQIGKVLVPTRNTITVRRGEKRESSEKIFPGYILVQMLLTDDAWLAVRTTPGVTGFVGTTTRPSPLSEAEVEAIQKFAKQEAPKFKIKFSLAEAVKINDGPFAEFLGSIESIDEERGRVKVLVSIFGRETPVELDFLQISKI